MVAGLPSKSATSRNVRFCAVKVALGDVMQDILSYNIISCGQLWSAGFFLRCSLLVIPLKKAKLKLWAKLIGALRSRIPVLFLCAEATSPGPCDVKNNALPFIPHDLSNIPGLGATGYCELYGNGYITIIISYLYMGVDMTDLKAVGNLESFRLTFDLTASTQVTNRVNGTQLVAASATLADRTNESILTWKPCRIPAFGILEDRPCSNQSNTINAFAANNFLHPGGSPCLVASNKILGLIETGDFAACTSDYPLADTYERYVNTSVYLGGRMWT
jgi:hypothetical protein